MLPTVAPFPSVQPHHHFNHYHTPGTVNPPYGFNPSAFSSSLSRNDPTKNNFQSIPRTRLQYPHPVQRLDLRDTTGPRPSPTTVGEHALRRKTPNGTLAAGYDGTPGDTTIQPPASKHILVSSLESGQLLSPQTGLPMEHWQQPTLDQSSRAKPSNFPPIYKNDVDTGGAIIGDPNQDSNGTGWVRSLNYDPGVDSVLNQTLPTKQQSSQRFYLPNDAYVPTVLPATLQPCVGPTASAGSGPYGPYWPDGAYIPYRPAAQRDSRFNSPAPFAEPPNLQLYDPSFNAQKPLPPGNQPDTGFSWNQPPLGMLNHDPSVKGNFPARHSDQKVLETASNPQIPPYHTRQNSAIYSNQSSNDAFAPWPGSLGGHNFQNPGAGVNSRAANVEFKEKILSWAHGVYVDLLASIHQARRNSISNGSGDGANQHFLRPSIYPKPPRQPGLDFSQHHISNPYDLQVQKANAMGNPRQDDHLHIATKIPANRHHFQRYGVSDAHAIDRLRHTGRFATSALPVSRFSAGSFNENPSASAASALEMLSHLCIESGWEWIDGMLLGGCLAYGLGDYHKAMRWYSRIISRDTT